MIRDRNIASNANINPAKLMGGIAGGGSFFPVAETYYVDRNTGTSGDGKSIDEAFLTFNEAILKVNADYTAAANNGKSKGRMRRIVVMEGWYSETGSSLTANDVHIIGAAPGHHDSIVLYGSLTAGDYDDGAVRPMLSLRGSNCTIENIGFVNRGATHSCVRFGANASDPDSPTRIGTVGNELINVDFVRDQADAAKYGLLDYGMDGTLVYGCFFSTSISTAGVYTASDGVVNPVNPVMVRNRFVGVPTGIQINAGHNALIWRNWFMDDTSDRADTSDTPIVINGTGQAWENYAQGVNAADIVTGSGTISEIRNFGDDS
jgi:hypothetical protein